MMTMMLTTIMMRMFGRECKWQQLPETGILPFTARSGRANWKEDLGALLLFKLLSKRYVIHTRKKLRTKEKGHFFSGNISGRFRPQGPVEKSLLEFEQRFRPSCLSAIALCQTYKTIQTYTKTKTNKDSDQNVSPPQLLFPRHTKINKQIQRQRQTKIQTKLSHYNRQKYKDETQKACTRNIFKIWECTMFPHQQMNIMFPSTMFSKIGNRDCVIFQGRRNMEFAGNPAADQYIPIVNFPSSFSGKRQEYKTYKINSLTHKYLWDYLYPVLFWGDIPLSLQVLLWAVVSWGWRVRSISP